MVQQEQEHTNGGRQVRVFITWVQGSRDKYSMCKSSTEEGGGNEYKRCPSGNWQQTCAAMTKKSHRMLGEGVAAFGGGLKRSVRQKEN